MESSSEAERRRRELAQAAPIRPACIWSRGRLGEKEVLFLCGTIGVAFDMWQRKLAVLSAADALFSQQIGLEAVERVMDETEGRLRKEAEAEGKKLLPRWSPGYGDKPLSLSRLILEKLNATKRIGVGITDTDLLVPSKSVTAVCEIEEREQG